MIITRSLSSCLFQEAEKRLSSDKGQTNFRTVVPSPRPVMKHAGKMTLDVFTLSGKTSKRPSKEKSEDSSPNHVALLPLFTISTAATPTANHEDSHKLFQNLKYNSIKPGSKGFNTKRLKPSSNSE